MTAIAPQVKQHTYTIHNNDTDGEVEDMEVDAPESLFYVQNFTGGDRGQYYIDCQLQVSSVRSYIECSGGRLIPSSIADCASVAASRGSTNVHHH